MSLDLNELLWEKLIQIQNTLLLDDTGMGKLLDLSQESFSLMKQRKGALELGQLDVLTNQVGISMNQLFSESLDLNQIRNLYFGNEYTLPRKYDFAKFSKSRTIINCLTYIEMKFGSEFRNTILRELQVDPRFFDSPDRQMNIGVLRDLCSLLAKFGMKEADFINMGKMSYFVNKEEGLGKDLGSHSNVIDLFADICENHSDKFDQNFDYFITKCEKDGISIGSKPTELALDYLDVKEVGSSLTCITKLGVFGSFPHYLNFLRSYAIKTKCMRQGDNIYEYKIFYTS